MLGSPVTHSSSWNTEAYLWSLEVDSHIKGHQEPNFSALSHYLEYLYSSCDQIHTSRSFLSLVSQFSASSRSFLFVPVCIAGVSVLKFNPISITCVLKYSHFLHDILFSLHKYLCILHLLLVLFYKCVSYFCVLTVFRIWTGEEMLLVLVLVLVQLFLELISGFILHQTLCQQRAIVLLLAFAKGIS